MTHKADDILYATLDRPLTLSESRAWRKALATDATLRSRWVSAARTEAVLLGLRPVPPNLSCRVMEAIRQEARTQGALPPQWRKQMRPFRILWMLGAAAALTIGLGLRLVVRDRRMPSPIAEHMAEPFAEPGPGAHPETQPFARIVAAGPGVSIVPPAFDGMDETGRGLAGKHIAAGTRLTVTGENESVAVMTANEEAQVTLFGNTEAILKGGAEHGSSGLMVELRKGKAEMHVRRSGYPCAVRTDVGVARAVGTQFTVQYNEREDSMNQFVKKTMFVTVISGMVAVGQTYLTAGEDASVEKRMTVVRKSIGGIVESVDRENGRLVVRQPARQETDAVRPTLVFSLSSETQVHRGEEEQLSLEAVVPGQYVRVVHDENQAVLQIFLRAKRSRQQ